jgi:hypothetical protein
MPTVAPRRWPVCWWYLDCLHVAVLQMQLPFVGQPALRTWLLALPHSLSGAWNLEGRCNGKNR